MLMFIMEAFCLGVMGTAVGAILGSLLAVVLNAVQVPVPAGAQFFTMSSTLKFALETVRILGSMAVITLCCTVVSMIPSLKAARMKPVTAISHVG